MVKIDKPDDADRVYVLDDEKKRLIDWFTVNLPLPDVDIYAEPTRCYKINLQWAKIVMGLVSWLTDVAAWHDATDEGYTGIEQVAKFLQGVDCMTFQLRQNPTNLCLLEQSFDGGATWITAFDYSLCLAPLEAMIQTIFDATQAGEIEPEYSTSTTTINNIYPTATLTAMVFASDEACDTAGKDKIFGACRQLVNFINDNNIDFLQQVGQDIGNLAQQSQTIISAIPIVGLLPIDEAAGYIAFIVNELYGEYLAILDQALLDSVMCDLFCIAVANDCRLDFNDVLGYFSDKVSSSITQFGTTLDELVNFALVGTFSGDDYFYLLCYIQLHAVGTGGTFNTISQLDAYTLQGQLGANNPSNDWTLLCDDCPTFGFWEYYWDFSWGTGDLHIEFGTVEGDGIRAVDFGSFLNYQIFVPLGGAVYNIKRIAALVSGNHHIGNGSDDKEIYSAHPNEVAPYGTGSIIFSLSFIAVNGTDLEFCADSSASDNSSKSVQLTGSMTDAAGAILKIKRYRIIGADNGNGKPAIARWRTSAPLCADFIG